MLGGGDHVLHRRSQRKHPRVASRSPVTQFSLPRTTESARSASGADLSEGGSEAAGFRPCLRCRPETAPFSSAWKGSRTTVERALRLIVEEGALDQEGATVERLAQRLGMGSRQLTRLFARYVQASPSKVARTARVQRAKRLLDETSLPMTEIAMRAGFGSLRRFNSHFAEVYRRPPTEIRRTRRSAGKAEQTVADVSKEKALVSPRARCPTSAPVRQI